MIDIALTTLVRFHGVVTLSAAKSAPAPYNAIATLSKRAYGYRNLTNLRTALTIPPRRPQPLPSPARATTRLGDEPIFAWAAAVANGSRKCGRGQVLM